MRDGVALGVIVVFLHPVVLTYHPRWARIDEDVNSVTQRNITTTRAVAHAKVFCDRVGGSALHVVGEYDTHHRTNCSTYWCTTHVGSGTVSVIVFGQRSDREKTG